MVDRIVYASLVFAVETIIMIGLNYAVFNARRLKIGQHRKWIYVMYITQLLTLVLWMLVPGLTNYGKFLGDVSTFWRPFIHVTLGLTVGITATIVITIMTLYPDINVGKMKRMRPLMLFTYFGWMTNYILGFLGYLSYFEQG